MGKANRLRQQRANLPKETHERDHAQSRSGGNVRLDAASTDSAEPFIVTIHDVRHHLGPTATRAVRDAMSEALVAWDGLGLHEIASAAPGQTPPGMGPFDPSNIRTDLANARLQSRDMVRGILGMFGPRGEVTEHLFPLLGFIERAQAFSLGAISMIEAGNPLAAASLLRSLAENVASVFYVNARPSELAKLQPGAEHGLPMGRVIAAAEKRLPGFKGAYDRLSSMAHPSGAGNFQTLRAADDNTFTWQSYPRFKDESDPMILLSLLSNLSEMSATVIQTTVRELERSGDTRPQT